MTKHIPKKCNVRGCKTEARYWIPTAELSGDFDMKNRHTFYLCADHVAELCNGDETDEVREFEYIHFLNPETGKIRIIEVGVYSCDEECTHCNN